MIGVTRLLTGRRSPSDRYRYDQRGHRFHDDDGYHPVVVWNITEACNLRCLHCYYSATFGRDEARIPFEDACRVIDGMARARVPVLLLTGGEPLVRRDILDIARYARDQGIDPVLSTNGTRIQSVACARRIREHGIRYVGISIDGERGHHDEQRQCPGSFERSMRAVAYCRDAGIRVSMRFTLTPSNASSLPAVLDLAQEHGVDRFCMYHLVPAGRGTTHADVDPQVRREALELLFAESAHRPFDILTVDSPADGPLLHQWAMRNAPEVAADVLAALTRHGGDGTGRRVVEIDHAGFVHPNQFWRSETFGNVLETPFDELWNPADDSTLAPLLRDLREDDWPLHGACGSCSYRSACGGFRARAAHLSGGDWLAADPSCVLTEREREPTTRGGLEAAAR